MSTLARDALRKIGQRRRSLELGTPRMAAQARELQRQDGVAIEPRDLSAIARRCVAAFSTGQQHALAGRDWREAAWCLWATEPALAGSNAGLHFLEHMAAHGRRPELKRLASVYVRDFKRDRPLLTEVAEVLRERCAVLGPPWVELGAEFALFEPATAAQALGLAAIERRASPGSVLAEGGLRDIIARGGLAEAAFLAALDALENWPKPSAPAHVQRVRALVTGPDGRWLHRGYRGRVADAVVVPLEELPDGPDREVALTFLITELKDPRLFPREWLGAERAKDIVTRWLTHRSLREFLDVVDRQVERDATARRQWRYRRAFWEGLFEHPERPVGAAWVVFGEEALPYVRRIQGGVFGRFAKPRPASDRSALILRVHNCIIAEWSHSGRCHIWTEDSTEPKPSLTPTSDRNGQFWYRKEDLSRPAGARIGEQAASYRHDSPEDYYWQRNVAAFLRRHAALRLTVEHYKVR